MLWVVTIAGLILLGAKRAARVNLAVAHGELGRVQAHWLARAGIEQALAILEDDGTAVDSMPDTWYDDPLSFEDVELVGGSFSVTAPPAEGADPRVPRCGLIDHASRVDLNAADEKQLSQLAELTESQVDAILDWRDGDDQARPGGAEGGFYQHLKFPYQIRNGPFRTLHELLLVRGIDEPTFYAEDANLNGILDANEDDQGKSPPEDDGDGQLKLGLAGLVTVYAYELNKDAQGNDRLNLNSADKATLMKQLDFTDALADAVVKRRGQKKFQKLMDLLEVKAAGQQTGPRGGEKDAGKVNEITLKWLAEHLDEITVSDEKRLPGRINVNTAGREVLLTLPEMTKDTAEAIMARRAAAAGPFRGVGELFTSNTVSESQFRALAERVTVRSNVFEIRSSARTDWGIRQSIVAIVDRGAQPMAILYWYQSE
ncbi:MAG: hypothetical protein AMJ81_09660 [Phycisphaerae bacterium SM23_33]|nr:MAG: hypothetical protein AMJ81_09660 [Phycisphaerae bacterium SM23_33]